MIVKNEASNIMHVLESVERHVNGVVVCDTGSQDETLATLDTFCGSHKAITCRTFQHTWEDFSHNRNLCFQDGRRVMSKLCRYWLDKIFFEQLPSSFNIFLCHWEPTLLWYIEPV